MMIFWHIQMFLPEGRGGTKIDSSRMLKESEPIIGTGEWDNFQCRQFKNANNTGLKVGDIVLVREGERALALCKVIGDVFQDVLLTSKYLNRNFRKVHIIEWYSGAAAFPQPQKTLERLKSPHTQSYIFINNWYKNTMKNMALKNYTDLLYYKKQIILQGPPGTGKTRLAKKIAEQLVGFENKTVDKPKAISDADIKSIIKAGKQISSSAGNAEYTIVDVLGDRIKSIKLNGTQDETLFKNIRSAFSSTLWDTKIEDNPTRRAAAFAKYIYDNINSPETKLEDSDQFKLVQFHPSYTYEDFVRGIVAKPNPTGNGVLYVAENKALGEFAKRALDNYLDSKKPLEIISQEVWVRERIKDFQKYLEGKLGNDEKIWLTQNTAYITRVTNETIRYKGDNWKIDGGVPYPDLEKMYLAGVASLTEIRELQTLTLSAKSNTTYWQKVLELFKDYLQTNNLSLPKDNISDKIRIKNYVLIIDEINRANLSSVLGELIYALEYRGEGLDGMYAVDDSGDENANKKLILPPNLYIIGTMNTADRSVGHIDYAIRRRFAFVDVLPENLQSDNEIQFQSDLFKKVAELFVSNLDEYLNNKAVPLEKAKYLSSDFEAKDVWLGHSYFIQKKVKDATGNEALEPLEMATRLKYEIVPILNEYVKDGVLNNNTETLDKIKEIANYSFS